MSIVTGFIMEKRNRVWIIELACMTFSTMCFLACSIIGIIREYLLVSIFMTGLAVLCAVRAGCVLYSFAANRNKMEKRRHVIDNEQGTENNISRRAAADGTGGVISAKRVFRTD